MTDVRQAAAPASSATAPAPAPAAGAVREHFVDPSQLCVGMHVHLDLSWRDHPFTFSSFQIKSLEQVETIQSLGLKRVRWSPDKSTARPLPPPRAQVVAPMRAPPVADPQVQEHDPIKRALAEQLNLHASRMKDCQRDLASAAKSVRSISSAMRSRPAAAAEEASRLVERIVGRMPPSAEIAIHLMNDSDNGEEVYHHSLNVALLAMMLARELKVGEAGLRAVGMGALFHDIGKLELPTQITRKTTALTRPEANLLETHVPKGVEMAARAGLPEIVQTIVAQHHECADGSGYPRGLRGEQVAAPSRIVCVVNAFDELCNPSDPTRARTPHEALSLLYGQQRSRFDAKVLATFVRCMGIYPPGTVVGLSNGLLGMVVSVNSSRPLKPTVMVFDLAMPRDKPLVVDLENEKDVSVARTLRPQQLPPKALEYLSPGRRTTYYFDAQPAPAAR